MLNQLKKEVRNQANPEKAKLLMGFFKTGKGEYGEGDIFVGLMVPESRKIAKKYKDLSLNELQKLISSKIHEERLIALFILQNQYEKSENKEKFIDFYLKNTRYINNWDLIDLSAPRILGDFLVNNPKKKTIIYKFSRSKDLWEKRISILATFAFIRINKFEDTLKISEILLNDKHDLIHKAVGWMLRELGKRDQNIEEKFLKNHYKKMPRTMLRYSIERFDDKKRKFYMKK